MKKIEIAVRHFMALAMTMLFMAVTISCLFPTPSYAEFYRYNIDELARKAKVRLQEIEKKMAEEKTVKELQDLLARIRTLYDKAESLYGERRYEEAISIYRKIDKISRDSKILNLPGEGK